MEAEAILRIRPALTHYLHQYDDCFGRRTARRHINTYVEGQLGPLPRKSVEPIADAAGVPPRDLQQFLSLYRWDESAMRDRCQQLVASRHTHKQSVGILDETSFAKKGNQTACVQRQHCGAAGKTENCVVSVHLGYATPDFHTLLDGELYLPKETWHEDRPRCRAAGIPDDSDHQRVPPEPGDLGLHQHFALPNIFANNMVLQADKPIHLWGIGPVGSVVHVRIDSNHQHLIRRGQVCVDALGRWSLFLPALPASFTRYNLSLTCMPKSRIATGKIDQLTIHDVLIGEVWLSAGQSNMDFPVQFMIGGPKLVADADNPYIRNFCENVIGGHPPYSKQLFDAPDGRWFIADSPAGLTTLHVSAIGYSFALTLFAALNRNGHHVPVAVLNTATGDTNIRTWISAPEIDRVGVLRRNALSTAVRRADQQLPFDAPSALYNHKIAPLAGYTVRGIIWLQGENDVGGARVDAYYRVALGDLIASWRKAFLAPRAPFIAGELSCFPYWDNPTCCAAMRWTQFQACRAAGKATVISIYDLPLDWKVVPWHWQCTCHPEDKFPVGQRMARAALAMVYGRHEIYRGPTYSKMQVRGSRVDLFFRHVDGGLKISNPADGLRGFAICGKNRVFLSANAIILSPNVVQLRCKTIKHPVAVTYAFTDMCQASNLSSAAGLPATPFRTDSVPSDYLPPMPWLHCRSLNLWYNNQRNAYWTKTWRPLPFPSTHSAANVRFSLASPSRKIKGGAVKVRFSHAVAGHDLRAAFGPTIQGLGMINLACYRSIQFAVFNPAHRSMKLELELATKVAAAKETLPWQNQPSLKNDSLVAVPGAAWVVPTGSDAQKGSALLSPGWSTVTYYLDRAHPPTSNERSADRQALKHVHQILFILTGAAGIGRSHRYILLAHFRLN